MKLLHKTLTASVLFLALTTGGGLAHAQGVAGALTGGTGSSNKPRFGGFAMDLTVANSTGLNAVGQNYRNDFTFYIEPRWAVGARFMSGIPVLKRLTIAGRFTVNANVAGTDDSNFSGNTAAGPQGTCGNLTPGPNGTIDPTQVAYCNPPTATRRADYSDIWLTAGLPRFYTIPKLKIGLNASWRFVFPVSAQSRFQTLYLGMAWFLGGGRAFWKDRIRLGYSFGITKNIHGNISPQLQNSTGNSGTQGGNPYDGAVGAGLSNMYADPTRTGTIGNYNTNYSLLNIFSGGVQFHEKVSLDVLFILVDAYAYDHDCLVSVGGMQIDTCAAGGAVAGASGAQTYGNGGHRPSQVFWASINYQPLDYLGLSLAWINFAGRQKPDGSYRQGFISTDYNSFTSVMLSATFSVEQLMKKWL